MSRAEEERDRYEELLQELRVMLPGVEVLFAFMLTAVFASRFPELDRLGRILFSIALTMAALTVLLLVMPTVLHRMADIDRVKRIKIATVFQLAGSITLGISMCLALFVVMRFVFSTPIGVLAGGGAAAVWIGLWYVFPRLLRRRS